MATTQVQLFFDPVQFVDYLYNHFTENAEELGLNFVAYTEEQLRPEYPALLVQAGPSQRDYWATHTFIIRVSLEIFIYHANLNASHKVRTREDMELAGAIRDDLHRQPMMEMWADSLDASTKQIIQGWVSAEEPAFIRRPPQSPVVATRMEWSGISQERFPKP